MASEPSLDEAAKFPYQKGLHGATSAQALAPSLRPERQIRGGKFAHKTPKAHAMCRALYPGDQGGEEDVDTVLKARDAAVRQVAALRQQLRRQQSDSRAAMQQELETMHRVRVPSLHEVCQRVHS